MIGFDIERHDYGTGGYPGQLVLQDVMTIHGSQFKDASVIVASPPCQNYSYMAMPWSRAKEMAAEIWADPEKHRELNRLFDACFRIRREASEAAGHHVPMVVENVKGAQPWVGSARWHFGSYYLWGDIPALMPFGDWFKDGRQGQDACAQGLKCPGIKFSEVGFNVANAQRLRRTEFYERAGVKQHGSGPKWFDEGAAAHSSSSKSRRAASAQIAKIPFPLAEYIAKVFKPQMAESEPAPKLAWPLS